MPRAASTARSKAAAIAPRRTPSSGQPEVGAQENHREEDGRQQQGQGQDEQLPEHQDQLLAHGLEAAGGVLAQVIPGGEIESGGVGDDQKR